MPTFLEKLALQVLYEAERSPMGLVLRTNDPQRAKTTLYRFRKQLGDPRLASLKVYISPTNPRNEIWIVKSEKTNAEQT